MIRKISPHTLLFLTIVPLCFGCTGSNLISNELEMVGVMEISAYPVVDITESYQLEVSDIIFDYKSSEIDYLVIKTPLSGFDLDIRTAPLRSNQIIMVPYQIAELEVETGQLILQTGILELENAPQFSLPVDSLPGNWRDTVDQYWVPLIENKE